VSSPRRESSITAATLIAGLLLLGGGTLGLEGDDADSIPTQPDSASQESSPAPDEAPDESAPGLLALAGLAAALAALQQRREDLSPAAGLSLDADPVVVFVPGHGQAQGSEAFADFIEHMAIDDEAVRHFDYRLIDGGSSAPEASADVGIDDAATGLNAYLAGVAGDGREIYLVGFSKGGATIAELVADWDAGRWGPPVVLLAGCKAWVASGDLCPTMGGTTRSSAVFFASGVPTAGCGWGASPALKWS
jgi:hypothetical protein